MTLWSWPLTFWPTITWVARNHDGLCQVWWLYFSGFGSIVQTRVNTTSTTLVVVTNDRYGRFWQPEQPVSIVVYQSCVIATHPRSIADDDNTVSGQTLNYQSRICRSWVIRETNQIWVVTVVLPATTWSRHFYSRTVLGYWPTSFCGPFVNWL